MIYRAGRHLSTNFSPRPGTVASPRAEVVAEGGRHVVVKSGVIAVSTVPGRAGDLTEAPAVEHEARPPAAPKAGRSD